MLKNKANNIKRRNTYQRQVIYEILKSTDIHPTADWIYERARELIPNISLGTVYRNLKILKEEGLILELTDGKQSRFDGRIDSHYHFKCEKCGSIYDVESKDVSVNCSIEEKGFTIKTVDVQLSGICSSCNGENAS